VLPKASIQVRWEPFVSKFNARLAKTPGEKLWKTTNPESFSRMRGKIETWVQARVAVRKALAQSGATGKSGAAVGDSDSGP